MKVATHLSNVKTAGFSTSVDASLDIFKEINGKPLPNITNNTIHHRIPGVLEVETKYGQRDLDLLASTFTFVPGSEAYPVGVLLFVVAVLPSTCS